MDGMTMSPPAMVTGGTSTDMRHNHMAQKEMSDIHMTFFWGKNSQILFSGWPGNHTGMYVLALIVVFVMAVHLEWISHSKFIKNGSDKLTACLVQTIKHAVRMGLAYLLMLALMSFNVGALIVAIFGHAFGFFIFGSSFCRKSLPSEEGKGYSAC